MILDVGCGSGVYEQVSKYRGNVNVDISKPKNKIPNFVQCDCHSLPFRDGAFETSLFFDVIEHIISPILALKELKRVTQNKLIVGTPNALYLPKVLLTLKSGLYYPYSDHICTYGIPELKALMFRCGFKNIEIKAVTYIDDNSNGKLWRVLKIFVRSELKGRQLLCKVECG